MRCFGFLAVGLVGTVLSSTSAWQALSQATEKQEATGTVTGRVFCDDTNAPARLARVMLLPAAAVSQSVEQADRHGVAASEPGAAPELPSANSVQSGLDGSFTMINVKPGAYYAVAEMPGYLSSVSSLSDEDWNHPTASLAERTAKMLQRVSVEGGRTTVVNLSLERGASVSGTISFDDGSPAAEVVLGIQRENSDGSWSAVRMSVMSPIRDRLTTNDLGQYRIAGLTAGHYVIKAKLSLENLKLTGFLGVPVGGVGEQRYALSFYSGGKLRATKDSAFALTAGESRADEDIVIPLSKLHSVSGSVVAARDGQPLGGDVELLYGDDKKTLATVTANGTTGEFRLEFVPEGNFILRVKARDSQPTPEMSTEAAGPEPETQVSSTVKRDYGVLEQSIDVHGDMDGLVLSVPERSATTSAAQNSGSSQ
jgi:hypothetical protein